MSERDQDQNDVDDVAAAYRRLWIAETARQARVRSASGMSDNELGVLQFLLSEGDVGHAVRPSEIARHLSVTSASMTALLDRLERSGFLERVSHPTDRRSILIAPTETAATAVSGAIDEHAALLRDTITGLDAPQRAAVLHFLETLSAGADAASLAPASTR